MAGSVNSAASTADFEFAALSEAHNYRRALVEEFRPALQGRVLELGAGIGQFTQELSRLPTILALVAVEPDARFHETFSAALPDVQLVRGLAADVPQRSGWDSLVAINVLEHIQQDAEELAVWCELLREQRGRLCLFVPARPEIYAPLDQDFGHFRRYTRAGLRATLTKAGFQVERLHYYNWAGYFGWWLKFCVLRQRQFNAPDVRLFDRWIFPFVNWLERRVCRPPFGQSLLAIARARPEP